MDKPPSFNTAKLKAWAIILFVGGILLNQYPFLALFNQPVSFLSLPLLIFYLHILWIGVIVCLFFLMRAFRRSTPPGSETEAP